MLLLELADIAVAPNFVKRVALALVKVAAEVLDEDPATTEHDRRIVLAHSLLLNPYGMAPTFANQIVLNENIGSTTPGSMGADQENAEGDGALEYIVRDIYNDYLD